MKLTLKKAAIAAFIGFLGVTGLLTVTVNAIDVAKDAYTTLKDTYIANPGVKGALTGTIGGIENGFSQNVFGQNSFINLYGLTEKKLGKEYIIDVDSSYNIIKDNYGKLHFAAFKEDNSKAAEEIIELNKSLKDNGINMLYVQTPIKMIKNFTKLNPAIIDYSNENSDKIVAQLRSGDVDVIDLRNLIDTAGIEKNRLFYNTDHHWTIETAFWGVSKVVEKIRTIYGVDLDPKRFYTDVKNYDVKLYEDNFLGSQGRRVGKYYGGVDDFSLITPKFDTHYSVTINKRNKVENLEGSFEESIINKEILEEKDMFTNRYVSYFGADYPEIIMKNHETDNDFKILIVKDSFGIPFSAFISTMAGETRMVDTRYYKEKSVKDYALEYKPDLVIYVYRSIRTIQ
ncbi:MAG: hypothetical protein WBH44_01315 [Proteocatella sp.]